VSGEINQMTVGVLVVDEHELIRQGLRRVLDASGEAEVIGEASRGSDAIRLLGLLAPKVLCLETRLPDMDGLDVVRRARIEYPELGIVVLSSRVGDEALFSALDSGASAFVSKSAPADDVVSSIRHAAASPRAFTAADLAEAMKRRLSPSGPQLSPREREVLTHLAEGMSVAEIARALFISESTTKTHISKLYDKLGVANRPQAIMAGLRMGLLRNPELDQ
jgi:DNA-binding NarL/FixJ family response regulator